jgi:arylsulfatase A-like enzyme
MRHFPLILFFAAIVSCCATCRVDKSAFPIYKTQHVIVVVVDGARYSETWGDTAHTYIPFRGTQLFNEGVVYTNFQNSGSTWTSSGHASICTGYNESLENSGNELPLYPSFMQYWRKANRQPAEKAWVITSKDKLFILANCRDEDWQSLYTPKYDCGNNGPFTGYRDDSTTVEHVFAVCNQYRPDLLLINLKEPDAIGHAGDWNGYLNQIAKTDQYLARIWQYIQNDPYYKNTTTLVVTNDHGRHLDGVSNGFVSHGDNCAGCRHVECVMVGPDFKKGMYTDIYRDQRDISATIAELLHFEMPTGNGNVMREVFK